MSYFPEIDQIKYEGVDSDNMFAFKHYNPEQEVLGMKMKDRMKFSVAYWHTFVNQGNDPFGAGVNKRPWFDEDPMTEARNKVDAAFEMFTKLGIEYFCFHDMDIAPFGDSLEEFFKNLDEITNLIKEKMDETGVKLLWNTADRHTNPLYVNGAASSPNLDVYALSAAQVKKGIDISKKLNGESFVFWGGREGYENLINTNMELEEANIANLYHMVIKYADEIGHEDLMFLLEPKPKEPMTHQYDYDAATSLAFIHKYNLADRFQLNLEANHATLAGHTFDHEMEVARINNALGSLDANHGETILGWDTDEFPFDLWETTMAMTVLLEQGNLPHGGINFDAKVRRTSFDTEDLFLAHIAGMDTYAQALKIAAAMKKDKFLETLKEERYQSYDSDLGKKVTQGATSLDELTDYALSIDAIENKSGHIEWVKSKINHYITQTK